MCFLTKLASALEGLTYTCLWHPKPLDYFNDIKLTKGISENISRRNVNLKLTNNSPSNILPINAQFQSYFQKMHRSRQHLSRRPLGRNGLVCTLGEGGSGSTGDIEVPCLSGLGFNNFPLKRLLS